MQYAILIFGADGVFDDLPEDDQRTYMQQHRDMQTKYEDRLGAIARLMPSTSAMTVTSKNGSVIVTDGPYAESKEQLLGLYIVEADSMEEAIEAAKMLPTGFNSMEVRPVAQAPVQREAATA
ncbi:YciI family protein [Cucumibacter marinus]|uniref:YciI family protein n=1 Tax=Cucumibacter marinus TaxID=1121252 RepID=UPI00041E56F8|nr:YciI family protein [Cucumibacter marinus]